MRTFMSIVLAAGVAWVVAGHQARDASASTRAYTITTLSELQDMNSDLAGNYVLAADIDAAATAGWNGGEGFVPIGNQTTTFTGTFDGQLHTISNLHINRPGVDNQGLFGLVETPGGSLDRAVIERVRLVDAEVTGGRYGATLVGNARHATVRGCGASGVLVVVCDASAEGKSGGLIGNVNWGSDIDQCFSAVSVFSGNCHQVGGLIGYLRGVETVTTLSNSYSRLPVWGTGSAVGGLLGQADGSMVDRCFATGRFHALIGSNYRDPVITNSYWDAEVGPATSMLGGTPKTTAEMMLQSTYVGWDFSTKWQIIDTQSYPWFQEMVPVELVSFTVD